LNYYLKIKSKKYIMKNVVSILAVAAFLFTMNVSAQEKEKEAVKKEVAKTEKKSCAKEGGKKSCCAAKKTEEKAELAQ
jgi:hypothetical protein